MLATVSPPLALRSSFMFCCFLLLHHLCFCCCLMFLSPSHEKNLVPFSAGVFYLSSFSFVASRFGRSSCRLVSRLGSRTDNACVPAFSCCEDGEGSSWPSLLLFFPFYISISSFLFAVPHFSLYHPALVVTTAPSSKLAFVAQARWIICASMNMCARMSARSDMRMWTWMQWEMWMKR